MDKYRPTQRAATVLDVKAVAVSIMPARFTFLSRLFQIMLVGGKKVGLMETAKGNKKELLFIKELLETRKIVPVIDRTCPFSEVPEAIRQLDKGHAQGKVVITMAPADKTSQAYGNCLENWLVSTLKRTPQIEL